MSETSAALIDQLVYIDNFINSASDATPNLDVDGQLLLDLAAFADDSFIFPDEDKPRNDDDGNDHFREIEASSSANRHWFDPGSVPDTHDTHNHDDHLTNYHDPLSSLRGNDGPRALESINQSTKLAKLSRKNHLSADHDQLPLLDANVPNLSGLPKFPVPPGAQSSLQQAGLSQNQIDLLSALIAQHQNSLGNEIPSAQVKIEENTHSLQTQEPHHDVAFAIAPTLASHTAVETPGSFSPYSSSSSTLSTPRVGRGSVSSASQNNDGSDLDKRRRNTAASARFRIKKKLKEREMEAKIEQLDDMIKRFELKIGELEMENRLLKNLIIEKGNRNSEKELKLLQEKVREGR